MAFPVVASVSSLAQDNDTASLVVTAPTGIQTGDLLVAIMGWYDEGSFKSNGIPSGFTSIGNTGDGFEGLAAGWKVAVLADESAGSYTFPMEANTTHRAGTIMRITGVAPGSEVQASQLQKNTASLGTVFTEAVSVTPFVNETLAIVAFFGVDNSISYVTTTASYDSLPVNTWSERVDVGTRNGGSDGVTLGVASANLASTSQVTEIEAVFSASMDRYQASCIYLINAPQSATASNALLQSTPVTFSPLTGSTQSPTNDYMDISPDFPTQSGEATVPSVWTTITKA